MLPAVILKKSALLFLHGISGEIGWPYFIGRVCTVKTMMISYLTGKKSRTLRKWAWTPERVLCAPKVGALRLVNGFSLSRFIHVPKRCHPHGRGGGRLH
ncbi:hypothetical protein BC938DRAFT_471013 [Jimgerdemannia flammicorona]|uniref:Uncharacterized protein n=1 Tax=Jimgerdemannia flammicorona TaxID=994334 RepID=A0A433Q900_9FUNG|nr:hypothetical protein BC938DRAFT_471013 [Jimgerdemannia flammicorona]